MEVIGALVILALGVVVGIAIGRLHHLAVRGEDEIARDAELRALRQYRDGVAALHGHGRVRGAEASDVAS